jgi:hypothetical protein
MLGKLAAHGANEAFLAVRGGRLLSLGGQAGGGSYIRALLRRGVGGDNLAGCSELKKGVH